MCFILQNNSLVELCIFELQQAITFQPIVFAMVDGKLKLCGVLGLENRQNLFLDDHGHWLTPFVPAVIRVAPFSLGQTSAGEKILLFIEDDEKIVTRNEGYPLFNEDGSDTQLIRSLSDLLIRIEKSNHIMDKACSFLSELELLEFLSE